MVESIETIMLRIDRLPKDQQSFILEYKKFVESDSYTENNLGTYLKILNLFAKESPGLDMRNPTKEEILVFLNRRIKSKNDDPEQKWITTWNHYRDRLSTVYRWYENRDSDKEQEEWSSPELFRKIKKKMTKRESPYNPDDVWMQSELITFMKYIPNLRDKVLFALLWDLAGRNHEVTMMKLSDIRWPEEGEGKFAVASIPFETKTGTRTNPLIMSYPYLIQWLKNGHPFPDMKTAPLVTDQRSKKCKGLSEKSVWGIFDRVTKNVQKLLETDKIDAEDLPIINRVLAKPHNPYLVGRHSSITHNSDNLSDQGLKQFAGWTHNSKRIATYAHRRPGQILNPLLKAAGFTVDENTPKITTKTCPSCQTVNTAEAMFCTKCDYVLSVSKFNEMKEERKQKEKEKDLEMKALRLKLEEQEKRHEASMAELKQMIADNIKGQMKHDF